MAGVVDRFRKKNKQRDWSNNGSFINKPERGWLHPDEQLAADAGVCYGVRYVGAMEVKESMKSLDFETRTAVAKESISQVCDAAGLKTAAKKSKRGSKISRLLGDEPIMVFAGQNVNLTISVESLSIMEIERGDIIGNHRMPSISFASGGDPDTLDFVAYVAKDENGRLCHVLECGGGLAQDVITTIGQAFELRFKLFLAEKPTPVTVPCRTDSQLTPVADQWGEDLDYYNDRLGARPPSPQRPPQYDSPRPQPEPMGAIYSSVRRTEPDVNLINFDDNVFTSPEPGSGLLEEFGESPYSNTSPQTGVDGRLNGVDNNKSPKSAVLSPKQNGELDAFDMKPFCNTLPVSTLAMPAKVDLNQEKWFHGKISRQQCEQLLVVDGAFLVRESPSTPSQFVLSGRNNGRIKHLLLVDPEGVVRTKDRTFASVGHLVEFHMTNNLPILSQETELSLRYPVLQAAHS